MAPSQCQHTTLQLSPSAFAELAGFERADARKRIAATTASGRGPPASSSTTSKEKDPDTQSQTFPAPLILPHDDLNYDPECPGQSMRSWLHEKARNKPTPERRTLYVAAAPDIDGRVSFMREWTRPNVAYTDAGKVKQPELSEVVEYLQAFYHGLEVRPYPSPLRWTAWQTGTRAPPKVDGIPKHVGLAYGDCMTRVRTRACPDKLFPAQLNLNDMLDAAAEMLPADAYAILLLTEHDIHEDEDDDYCCGRAYGGSRICVVQSARYSPLLDSSDRDGVSVDYAHAWPMSHCKSYADQLCAVEDVKPAKPTAWTVRLSKSGAMRAAISAGSSLAPPRTPEELRGLWFSRVARTASHELGHCLGMGHCVYYACNMQGTAGMKEDARQPPYLCPVCLAKLEHAVVGELQRGGEAEKSQWSRERYRALEMFCEDRDDVVMWRALSAWIKSMLAAETSRGVGG